MDTGFTPGGSQLSAIASGRLDHRRRSSRWEISGCAPPARHRPDRCLHRVDSLRRLDRPLLHGLPGVAKRLRRDRPGQHRVSPNDQRLVDAQIAAVQDGQTDVFMSGVYSQFMQSQSDFQREVAAFLGHNPETDRILGFLYLGSAAQPPDERPRPALSDVVSEWKGTF